MRNEELWLIFVRVRTKIFRTSSLFTFHSSLLTFFGYTAVCVSPLRGELHALSERVTCTLTGALHIATLLRRIGKNPREIADFSFIIFFAGR